MIALLWWAVIAALLVAAAIIFAKLGYPWLAAVCLLFVGVLETRGYFPEEYPEYARTFTAGGTKSDVEKQ